MLILALISLAFGFDLLQQTYTAPGCAGSPVQINVVSQATFPTCPYPARQCLPNPVNPGQSISVECASGNGATYNFPAGFAVAMTYQAANCAGNTTTASGFLANTCLSLGGPQRIKFDCSAKTVTNCVGTADCSDPACQTTPIPSGCVSAGSASTQIKCT